MKTAPTFFCAGAVWLAMAGPAAAELPRYSVTRTSDFFPALGPAGDPAVPNRSVLYTVSAGTDGYLAAFADFEHPVTLPGSQIVTPSETNYILDADTLKILNVGAPPADYITGTSGAVRSSSAGHIVFSVSGALDRNTPGWLDRIQVARTSPDGTTTVLPGGQGIEQRGVNASGTVIGVGPDDFTAWRYTDDAGWQSLGSLGPSGYAHPRGISDSGVIVGRSADATNNLVPFFWTESGGMQAITNQGSALFGEAAAISNNGLITGTANGRAFIFNAETLEFRFVTDPVGLFANDINSAGAIIGASHFGGTILGIPVDTAFYWDADTGLTGFEQLIGDEVNDWFIIDATDINDNGWILGTGFRRSDETYHQVLLRPVPEPGAALLLGCAALAACRRRRK